MRGQHTFSQIPQANIPRSRFNRTHGFKTTFNSGLLVPFFVDEVLPGDTFSVRGHLFARLATPFVPVMDNMYLDTFYFFVPNRLVWTKWPNFMGEQDNPDDQEIFDYITPLVTTPAGGWAELSIGDYFALPTKVPNLTVQALPFRAYNLIWNEWFRDQNLQDRVTVKKDDGPDDPTLYELLRRGKRHDYFTSALPWPQKGPGVEIPLGTSAPITYEIGGQPADISVSQAPSTSPAIVQTTWTGGASHPQGTPIVGVADLSQASAATINSLRQAFQIQKLYERDARGGTRYTEVIRSHFGVISPDARMQRPEYLGGSTQRVGVSPIAQTSATHATADDTTPQGHLAAIGSVSSTNGFTKSFTEHGFVMGLMMVRADLSYQQGINRMWFRRTRFDYYWPALAHLGEQTLLNKEIFAQGSAEDDQAFGYQERWAEYRYKPSTITGRFRSNADAPLDVWHLAQKFDTLPTLNSQFIEEHPPIDRIIAVPSEPEFIMDGHLAIEATRPMPTYSVPGLIDHF